MSASAIRMFLKLVLFVLCIVFFLPFAVVSCGVSQGSQVIVSGWHLFSGFELLRADRFLVFEGRFINLFFLLLPLISGILLTAIPRKRFEKGWRRSFLLVLVLESVHLIMSVLLSLIPWVFLKGTASHLLKELFYTGSEVNFGISLNIRPGVGYFAMTAGVVIAVVLCICGYIAARKEDLIGSTAFYPGQDDISSFGSLICPACGAANEQDALRCRKCGEMLRDYVPPMPEASEQMPEASEQMPEASENTSDTPVSDTPVSDAAENPAAQTESSPDRQGGAESLPAPDSQDGEAR